MAVYIKKILLNARRRIVFLFQSKKGNSPMGKKVSPGCWAKFLLAAFNAYT